jgi:PAS domain S-box-containing protein
MKDFLQTHVPDPVAQDALQHSAVVCLASEGNPVVYVSAAFEQHTGYAPTDAIGRNLSFLQGPDSEPEAIERFRELIRDATPGHVKITNYRKDGTRFVHECEMRPVLDKSGALSHFIAIQRTV